jgi:hypothetical protein
MHKLERIENPDGESEQGHDQQEDDPGHDYGEEQDSGGYGGGILEADDNEDQCKERNTDEFESVSGHYFFPCRFFLPKIREKGFLTAAYKKAEHSALLLSCKK